VNQFLVEWKLLPVHRFLTLVPKTRRRKKNNLEEQKDEDNIKHGFFARHSFKEHIYFITTYFSDLSIFTLLLPEPLASVFLSQTTSTWCYLYQNQYVNLLSFCCRNKFNL